MYETPKLERFGTFRELTQAGGDMGFDTGTLLGIPTDCTAGSDIPDFACRS